MRAVTLASEDDFEGWRDAARALAQARVPASEIIWQIGDEPVDLFGEAVAMPPPRIEPFSVPRAFLDLAKNVVLHSEPQRFAWAYSLLLDLLDHPRRIQDRADPMVRRLEELAKQVRRDIHKMRAFVRFREVIQSDGETRFVAWFEPEHHIVRANARFFMDRFANMQWSILTPNVSLHWDGEMLSEGPGATSEDAPAGDPVEEMWKTYYASTFNPARLKTAAMLKEMPRKYWHNMPETALVKDLIAGARQREIAMVETARINLGGDAQTAWVRLREEARACTRCPLHTRATQTVFGDGPADARIMIVGEQPGDHEDFEGRPFVGPAGELFDRAMADAGVDRASVYVTNAVKHFKYALRGPRRIHQRPDAGEVSACRWWYEQERLLIRPEITVAMGATAARQMLGKAVTIGDVRGRPLELGEGGVGFVTIHPSYLLRLPDKTKAADEYALFVEELGAAARLLT